MRKFVQPTLSILIVVAVTSIICLIVKGSRGIYDFFNNQTVAVTVGLVVGLLGYFVWRLQHKCELRSKYFELLLETTFSVLHSQDALVYRHKGKRSVLSDNLFQKRMLYEAKQDTYMMLLEALGDSRPEAFRAILGEFNEKMLEIMPKLSLAKGNTIPDDIQKEYSKARLAVRQKLLSIVEKGKGEIC